jgi:hypothetical protein
MKHRAAKKVRGRRGRGIGRPLADPAERQIRDPARSSYKLGSAIPQPRLVARPCGASASTPELGRILRRGGHTHPWISSASERGAQPALKPDLPIHLTDAGHVPDTLKTRAQNSERGTTRTTQGYIDLAGETFRDEAELADERLFGQLGQKSPSAD